MLNRPPTVHHISFGDGATPSLCGKAGSPWAVEPMSASQPEGTLDLIGADELRSLLRAACADAGSQAKWARQRGISTGYLADVLAGRADPSDRVAEGLGYERVVLYRRRTS